MSEFYKDMEMIYKPEADAMRAFIDTLADGMGITFGFGSYRERCNVLMGEIKRHPEGLIHIRIVQAGG